MFFYLSLIFTTIAGYIAAKCIKVLTGSILFSRLAFALTFTFPLSLNAVSRFFALNQYVCFFSYFYIGFIFYLAITYILWILFNFIHKIECKKFLSIGLLLICVLLCYGYKNAGSPILKYIRIPGKNNLKICFLSDLHVGNIQTKVLLQKTIKLIKKVNPDLVILGGDTIDKFAFSTYKHDFIQTFQQISKLYPTYAVLGNHEVYSGLEKSRHLMREAKIQLLEDKSIDAKEYTIIGRLDSSITNRKNIDKIIKDEIPEWENRKQDIVVVDHKPDGINESIEKGAILHLSGHTHNGQLFPINFITQMLYGETGALKKFKNTYTYISNGIGFWGPPYRIPYAPEIVVIDISKYTEK